MSDIVQQLTSQLGIGADQAEAGAGTVMNLIKESAASGDFQQLLGAVPEASGWMARAGEASAAAGGGLLGQATGLLGQAGGGATGLAGLVGTLGKLGISGDAAARFLPLLASLIKGKAGDALFGRLASSVPLLKEAMGGAGGLGGALGKLLG